GFQRADRDDGPAGRKTVRHGSGHTPGTSPFRPGESGRDSASPMKTVEILAPAGDEAAIQAALDAGAGAVFFGLGELDARRGAQGITASRLPDVVKAVHAGGAKAHLTLNI